MFSDLRFALRQLAKAPGFTSTIVITLALGIGACVTIFSLIDSVLLDLYGSHSARSVVISRTRPPDTTPLQVIRSAYPTLESELKSYEVLMAHWNEPSILTGEGEPQRIAGRYVTHQFFRFHGKAFVLGRNFVPDEHAKEGTGVVIITRGLWQRIFGGRSDIIGRTIQLNGAPCSIVGVIPEGFAPSADAAEVFLPAFFNTESRSPVFVRGILKAGVSLSQAQAELDLLNARLAEQDPGRHRGFSGLVTSFQDFVTRESRPVLITLFGAVVCVLLMACANIACLLLIRSTIRQREFSVRLALGASRARIVRQLLTESLILALTGGTAGLLIAVWASEALARYPRMRSFDTIQVGIDGRLIAFAIGVSVLTAILFGLVPAWLSSKTDLNESLKQGARGGIENRTSGRLRRGFVMLEVATATVLLTAAGLFVRSFMWIARVDLGLVPEHAFTVHVPVPTEKRPTDEQRNEFVDAVLERITRLPGVGAAGVTQFVPFASTSINTIEFEIDGRPLAEPGTGPRTRPVLVSPGYFNAAGTQLVRGRIFTEHDNLRSPKVVLISATFAAQHFPGENPLGRRVLTRPLGPYRTEWYEIVGVAADATQASPEQPITAQIYFAYAQRPSPSGFHLVVRTRGDMVGLGDVLKAQVYAVDPTQPVGPVMPIQLHLDVRVSEKRFQLYLLSVFSLLALSIAMGGIYGVIAYSVSQRTHEIGIRMALGAQATDVARLVLMQGARLIGFGLLFGLAAAIVVGRMMESRLFQVSGWDPVTLAIIAVLIACAGLLACFVPARRATKVVPMIALRAE